MLLVYFCSKQPKIISSKIVNMIKFIYLETLSNKASSWSVCSFLRLLWTFWPRFLSFLGLLEAVSLGRLNCSPPAGACSSNFRVSASCRPRKLKNLTRKFKKVTRKSRQTRIIPFLLRNQHAPRKFWYFVNTSWTFQLWKLLKPLEISSSCMWKT